MITEEIVSQYRILSSAYVKSVSEYVDECQKAGNEPTEEDKHYIKRAEENMEEHKKAFYSFAKHDWK